MNKETIVLCNFALILAAGCSDVNNSQDPEHVHEPATAQITVWTDRYEVFAEHQPPVAGTPTTFITHVTDLHTLEPRREGMVKFVLRQGESVVEHPENTPARTGIYLPGIVFPKAGDWQLALLIPTDGTNAIVELGTIRVYADEHSAAHAELPEPPEGISFLKEQQWKILSETQPATKRHLVERVQLPAQVRAKPGFRASIPAPLAGQLVLPPGKTFPQPGARVEAGEVLGLLQPRFSDAAASFVEIEAEHGRAEAMLKQAEAAYERIKTLAAQQAKSERELQEAEAALASARARYTAANALRSTYAAMTETNSSTDRATPALELRAPIAGVLTSTSAGVGEPVSADQVVFTVLNPQTVWIEAHVPEATVHRLGEAKDALCEMPDETGEFFSIAAEGGRLVFAGLEVDPATRTVPLIYELDNSEAQLRVSQAVRLHVETDQAMDAIAVPESAIVEEGGQPIAFVQVSGETFQKRELKLGIRDGNRVEVTAGINEGDRVVVKGAMAIRLASVSGVIPAHGHAH